MSARVVLGVAGASGAALALSVARQLTGIGAEIDLVVSRAARRTLAVVDGRPTYARVDLANWNGAPHLMELELIEPERPVVECRRKPKSVFDQGFLPGPVSAIHTAKLRNSHMTLIDDQQSVVGHIVEEAGWRFTLFPS